MCSSTKGTGRTTRSFNVSASVSEMEKINNKIRGLKAYNGHGSPAVCGWDLAFSTDLDW